MGAYRTPADMPKETWPKPKRKIDYITLFFSTLAICAASSLGIAIFFPLFKSITADGKINYCYIRGGWLYGNVEWREDRALIPVPTIDVAVDQAAKLKCEIH
jgi:hypothetical protein